MRGDIILSVRTDWVALPGTNLPLYHWMSWMGS